MKNGISRWKRVALGLMLLLGAASAKAEAPAHCSYGYQDSSCLGPQYRSAQTPPTCSTDAGWTTLTPAQWIGSGFTQPVCHYQAPPSCPSGYTQTGPVWDGSQWVSLSCTPTAPPDPGATCTSAMPSGYSGNITWQAAYAQGAANTAAVNNISGYATALASNRFYGPAYQSICGVSYYTYGATCYLNSDGSLNALLVFPDSAGNTGGCMH